jgi:hypothetical protein
MALWLLIQEASKHMEDKLKAKLMDNYPELMMDCHTKQLQRLKGTVRQLYTDGQFEQADAMWDMCMESNVQIEDADDCSTSSDE